MKLIELYKDLLYKSFTPPKNDNLRECIANKRRIEFIDLAKGICITLVVLYHTDASNFNFPNFNALRLPLYFILSGLFYKDYGDFKTFLAKKANNILVPFLFWYTFSFLLIWGANNFIKHGNYEFISFFNFLKTDLSMVNFALWFLICLFIVSIMFRLINSIVRNETQRCLIVILCGLIGYALNYYGILIPLYISSSFTVIPFYYLGMLLKKSNILIIQDPHHVLIFIGMALITLSYCFYYFLSQPSINIVFNRHTGNILLAYINSTCFVLGTLLICKSVIWLPIISYLGRYSIITLCIHLILYGNLPEIYELIFHKQMESWTLFLSTLLTCWLVIPICRKYLPYFTAQKELIPIRSTVQRDTTID